MGTKRKIKVNFVDFWGGFDPNTNFIMDLLRDKYEVVISDSPDYLFFSTSGNANLNYDCVKIMFVGENIVPDFNLCDYGVGFDYIDFGDRYIRCPLFCLYDSFKSILSREFCAEDVLNRKFCSIVVSNLKYSNPSRERFFRLLSEYKQVDSGGRMWNNIGGPVLNKAQFISQYKFNIAFENSSVLGYTTEKLIDAMASITLPIYWGNRWVGRDFNENSFVNVNSFPSLEAAVEKIVELDTNDELYLSMLSEPCLVNQSLLDWKKHLFQFLESIFEKPLEEARYLSDDGLQRLYRRNMRYSTKMFEQVKSNVLVKAGLAIKEKLWK